MTDRLTPTWFKQRSAGSHQAYGSCPKTIAVEKNRNVNRHNMGKSIGRSNLNTQRKAKPARTISKR